LKLSSYANTIEHLPVADNLWSDMLTRWAAPATQARMSALMVAPISPSNDEAFMWPTAAEVHRIQQHHIMSSDLDDSTGSESSELLQGLTCSDDDLDKDANSRAWIPSDACDLQMRICIVAHTGIGGHKGYRSTLGTIRQFFV
jgi:hypothetical protein